MRTTALFAASVVSASLFAGCTASEGGDPEDSVFVDDSKADDYFSTTAVEYILEGQSTVTLDASMATLTPEQKLAEAKKLVSLKQIAVAWFVTQYLVDKEPDEANHSFGGFSGIAKGGAFQDENIVARADGMTFDFTFRQLAAAGKNLMQQLPVHTVAGKPTFELEIGKPTNVEMAQLETNAEWYRNAPWSEWNPSTVAADKKETMTFTISRERESTDGYFDIARLVEDGKLDVDVYFGWDYHSDYHIKHSQAFFTWLKSEGFTTPVASWDAMTKDTGAFTKTVTADGKPVTVEVRFYFGKPGTATDPDTDAGGIVLENLARQSLATRDAVMYSGHSGPFYGFALANWRKTAEGDLDDTDMRVIPMPADKYQVILANGCDTYQIGEAFKENPNKAGKNVDVVTTMSFSNAGTPATVEDFLSALMANEGGKLRPQPISTLLTNLDSESWGFHSMYGIHGIDDNPKLIPFAKPENFGTACSANADCGGPGNLCVSTTAGKKCTAACAADPGCGTGYACRSVASSSTATIYGKACMKL